VNAFMTVKSTSSIFWDRNVPQMHFSGNVSQSFECETFAQEVTDRLNIGGMKRKDEAIWNNNGGNGQEQNIWTQRD